MCAGARSAVGGLGPEAVVLARLAHDATVALPDPLVALWTYAVRHGLCRVSLTCWCEAKLGPFSLAVTLLASAQAHSAD